MQRPAGAGSAAGSRYGPGRRGRSRGGGAGQDRALAPLRPPRRPSPFALKAGARRGAGARRSPGWGEQPAEPQGALPGRGLPPRGLREGTGSHPRVPPRAVLPLRGLPCRSRRGAAGAGGHPPGAAAPGLFLSSVTSDRPGHPGCASPLQRWERWAGPVSVPQPRAAGEGRPRWGYGLQEEMEATSSGCVPSPQG